MLIYTCQEFAGLFFILACSFTRPGRDCCYCARQTFFFSLQLLHSLGESPPSRLHTPAYLCVRVTPAPGTGKTSMKPLVSHTEISCIIGSSCSWVTSTDSFGKPDWVLSPVGVLVPQERQQLLLENRSSHGDVEGRQSCSSPWMGTGFLPVLGQQQEPAG